jgi:large repetitive protein
MKVAKKESRRARLSAQSLEARDVPSSWHGPAPANSQVSGLVYFDQNSDGQAQNWERRLEGVSVSLTGNDSAGNAISRQASTDAGGIYMFTGLPAGHYAISIMPPSGYSAGGDTIGAFGGMTQGTVISDLMIPVGQSSGAYNFGLLNGLQPTPPVCPPPPPPVCPPPAANSQISGLVYADENRDGVAQNTERRLQGVTVTLTGTDTGGNAVTRTTTTDQGGIYYFTALPAGTYAIQVTTPTGYTPGQSSVGAFGGNPQPNLVTSIVIPPGQSSGAYNFGELTDAPPCAQPPAQTSTLGGLVYIDLDRDGTFSDGDIVLPDVSVTITGITTGGQAVSLTTTTGTDGTYSFAGLGAGTYSVSVVQPDGLLLGHSASGSFGGLLGDNIVTAIPVPSGGTSAGYNFGFEEPRPR